MPWIKGTYNSGLLVSEKRITGGIQGAKGSDYEEIVIKIVGKEDALEIPLPYGKLLETLNEAPLKVDECYPVFLHQKYISIGGLIIKPYREKHAKVAGFLQDKRDDLDASFSGKSLMIEGIDLEEFRQVVNSIGTQIGCN